MSDQFFFLFVIYANDNWVMMTNNNGYRQKGNKREHPGYRNILILQASGRVEARAF